MRYRPQRQFSPPAAAGGPGRVLPWPARLPSSSRARWRRRGWQVRLVTLRPVENDVPPGGELLGDMRWEPWLPGELADRLAGVPVSWSVAGGWALDLFRGQVTRPHEDIEIAVPAAGFPAIRRALPGLEFLVAGHGRLWPLDSPAYQSLHQTWGRDRVTGSWRLDVFREPHQAGTWIYRCAPAIRRPYSELILTTADGIPYLAPEVALLFKARHPRPKDDADFAGSLPLLTAAQRGWLAAALRAAHPGHPWLAAAGLAVSGGGRAG